MRMTEQDSVVFGDLLRERRRMAALTQEELAERAGVSARAVSDLERGVYATAKVRTARQLADALQLQNDERSTFEAVARGEPASADRGQGRGPRTRKPQAIGSGRLPSPISRFIGRAQELEQVRDLLVCRGVRLVTLVGPGGSGKTRVAIESAWQLTPAFPDGVFFVSLAEVPDPRSVISAIAGALAMREWRGQTLEETVAAHLRSRSILLVLDNFEHLLPAATLISALLLSCPRLSVLATSRIPLCLSGEHRLPAPPMRAPEEASAVNAEALRDYEATALFVERASAVNPHITIDPHAAHAIAEICRRVDGLPLAIELAAAQVDRLRPTALLESLSAGMEMLTDAPCDAPERHRTLRKAIDWSFDLLSSDEQLLLTQLSAFVGGCTLQTAEAVCDVGGGLDVAEGLASLVHKSLLTCDRGNPPRFFMLDTIREYARERLTELEEGGRTIRDRHATVFMGVAEEGHRSLTGPDQGAWLVRLETEHDNLRAAFDWTMERQQWKRSLDLALNLVEFWSVRGHWEEGIRCLAAAMSAAEDADDGLRARALTSEGRLHRLRCDAPNALDRLSRAQRLWSGLQDEAGIARALFETGKVQFSTGAVKRARATFEEALATASDGADGLLSAEILDQLGSLAGQSGDYETAMTYGERSLGLQRRLGNPRGAAQALLLLGNATDSLGHAARSLPYLSEALALAEGLGDRRLTARCLHNLGFALWMGADIVGARDRFLEALAVLKDAQADRETALCLSCLGELSRVDGDAVQAGDYLRRCFLVCMHAGPGIEWAAADGCDHLARLVTTEAASHVAVRLWGAHAHLLNLICSENDPHERREREPLMRACRCDLGEVEWMHAWDEGYGMTLEQSVEYALGVVTELSAYSPDRRSSCSDVRSRMPPSR
jgi:predicted ATPase/DNA-binding XRE family transcriptional regulator